MKIDVQQSYCYKLNKRLLIGLFTFLNTKKMLLLVFLITLLPLCSSTNEPTLEYILAIKCMDDKPNKCLPYGSCCGHDEFCYQGVCESCLPFHLEGRDQQLQWCRQHGAHNVTLMRDPSCRVACQTKFSLHQLTGQSKTNEDKHKTSPSSDVKPTDNTWFHLFLAMSVACCVFLVLLLAVVALSLMMYRNIMLRHHRDRYSSLRRSSKKHSRRNMGASDGEDTDNRYITLDSDRPPEVPPPRAISLANVKYKPRLTPEVKDNLDNECETLTYPNQNSG